MGTWKYVSSSCFSAKQYQPLGTVPELLVPWRPLLLFLPQKCLGNKWKQIPWNFQWGREHWHLSCDILETTGVCEGQVLTFLPEFWLKMLEAWLNHNYSNHFFHVDAHFISSPHSLVCNSGFLVKTCYLQTRDHDNWWFNQTWPFNQTFSQT